MRSLVLMVWLVLAPLAGSAQAATELWCFGADWCRPCLRVGPVYERLIERGYTLRHVDYDRQRSVATAMRVGTLPSLVVVRDGRDVGRLVGANEISVNRVEQLAGPARQPAPAVALASASVPSTQLPAAGPEADGKLSVPPAVCAAICKISVWTGGNVWCGCTGTLVDEDHGRGLVLTCGHVFNEGNADILVTFPGGDRLQGRLLGRDPSVDLAAIEIMPVQSANPIEVAEDVAAPNSVVTTCGYGDDGCNKLAGSRGPVIQYVGLQGGPSDALMEIAGKSRNGDSGGPVLNTSFKQVGVLMGNDRRQTVNATGCGHMRRFLGRFQPRFLRRNQPGPTFQQAPTQQPALQEVPPPPAADNSRAIQLLEAELSALRHERDELLKKLQAATQAAEQLGPIVSDRDSLIGRLKDKAAEVLHLQEKHDALAAKLHGVEAELAERIKNVATAAIHSPPAQAAADGILDVLVTKGLAYFGPLGGPATMGLSALALWLWRRRRKPSSGSSTTTSADRSGGAAGGGETIITRLFGNTRNVLVEQPSPEIEAEAYREAFRKLIHLDPNKPMTFGEWVKQVEAAKGQIHDGMKAMLRRSS